jgi:hypothetical protein
VALPIRIFVWRCCSTTRPSDDISICMHTVFLCSRRVSCWLAGFGLCLAIQHAGAAGVTIITHGLNGDVDGWVTGMADVIPDYSRFPGTNSTSYELYFFPNGGGYSLAATNVSGPAPAFTDSGEIIIKLDWRQLADGNSFNTKQVANMVVPTLLNTNFIPQLGGHALAEFPLHLVGHSRGGSLVCEMSRLLGTNGVWVDHVSTLDAHPLRDPAFPFDAIAYSAVDAPARTYQNVLFADSYWQNIDSLVYGLAVPGAYVRKLTDLDGGYGDNTIAGDDHSDVHLWYDGTIDWRVPTSDTETNLDSSERQAWWKPYEARGTNAGFLYSLIGGGNRQSMDEPAGTGSGPVNSGFNQFWDLGSGSVNNRTTLSTNYGNWANVIRLNRTTTNDVAQGQSIGLQFYYQWAQPGSSIALADIYLDTDLNPLNTNQTLVAEIALPGTTAGAVGLVTTNLVLDATNATSGSHTIFAAIRGGSRTRFLYAPETVNVVSGVPSLAPPTLGFSIASPEQAIISWPTDHIGWRLEVQSSSLDVGLTGGWTTVSGSQTTNLMVIPIDQSSEAVFFRLVYP